jgi:flagellar basal body-associated protein FliL
MSSQTPSASIGGIAAGTSSAGTSGALSTNTLIIIVVVILALVIGLVLYIRKGSSDAKEARAAVVREKLALMKELESLEGNK